MNADTGSSTSSLTEGGQRDQDLMLCWGTVNSRPRCSNLIDAAAVGGYRSISVSPRLYAP